VVIARAPGRLRIPRLLEPRRRTCQDNPSTARGISRRRLASSGGVVHPPGDGATNLERHGARAEGSRASFVFLTRVAL
jgi:hypothetical protein